MFHNRVRPRADQRLSAIVISDCEDRLLGRPLTDLDDLRAVFRVSDRPSMDVQPVSDVCVHRYLLQPSQCLAAMAAATDPGETIRPLPEAAHCPLRSGDVSGERADLRMARSSYRRESFTDDLRRIRTVVSAIVSGHEWRVGIDRAALPARQYLAAAG
jgi:hypothetical protein